MAAARTTDSDAPARGPVVSSRPDCAWCGARLAPGSTPLVGRIRCAVCGVATTTPWPSDEELDAAYGSWYRPPGGRFGGIGDAALRWSRATLAGRIDRIAPPGRVLDVGAGDGTLLDALRARGRVAIGIERHSARDDVIDTPLESLEGEFAAIVFWHTLEHLPAPSSALQAAADRLAPSGVLIVALPNTASLQARLFGDRWFALDIPRHLVHVPAGALVARLRAAGLRLERVSFVRGGQLVFGWLHGLVGLLPGHPDLYDAIRRPDARRRPMTSRRRLGILAAGGALIAPAALCAAAEVAVRHGGTVEVEARRA